MIHAFGRRSRCNLPAHPCMGWCAWKPRRSNADVIDRVVTCCRMRPTAFQSVKQTNCPPSENVFGLIEEGKRNCEDTAGGATGTGRYASVVLLFVRVACKHVRLHLSRSGTPCSIVTYACVAAAETEHSRSCSLDLVVGHYSIAFFGFFVAVSVAA
jgi:hypothetical protein